MFSNFTFDLSTTLKNVEINRLLGYFNLTGEGWYKTSRNVPLYHQWTACLLIPAFPSTSLVLPQHMPESQATR